MESKKCGFCLDYVINQGGIARHEADGSVTCTTCVIEQAGNENEV